MGGEIGEQVEVYLSTIQTVAHDNKLGTQQTKTRVRAESEDSLN